MNPIFEQLAAPFPANEVEWRIQSSGVNGEKVWAIAIAYLTNRAIQERLDAVVGPENWQDRYETIDGGFLCGIGLKLGDEWVWKWDGADKTDIEAIKGGLSGAEKRAAVKWGIGRYLYDLKETFVETTTEKNNQWNRAQTKDKKTFWWKDPELPAWALPKPPGKTPTQPPPPSAPKPTAEYDSLAALLKQLGIKTEADANAVINYAVAGVGKIGELRTMKGECTQIEQAVKSIGLSGDELLKKVKSNA